MSYKKSACLALLIFSFFLVEAQGSKLYTKEIYTQAKDTLLYRMMLPEHFSESKQYPVVLMLHGAGERGSDNESQLVHGSSLFSDRRCEFPAIVIFPQCPKNDYWSNVRVDRSKIPLDFVFHYDQKPTKSLRLVSALLDSLLHKNYVKKDQVYVMGLSMGGMGTYELLFRKPTVFAAAIPICGAGDPEYVRGYAQEVPVWGFHGAMDDVVHPQNTLTMISAILKAGGTPKLTIYDTANHNSWDRAFGEQTLLTWLFSKKQ